MKHRYLHPLKIPLSSWRRGQAILVCFSTAARLLIVRHVYCTVSNQVFLILDKKNLQRSEAMPEASSKNEKKRCSVSVCRICAFLFAGFQQRLATCVARTEQISHIGRRSCIQVLTKANLFPGCKLSEKLQAVEDGRQRGAISLCNREVQSLSAPEGQCANKEDECAR